jgi:hypothetical protein
MGRAYVAAIFATTSRYIRMGCARPLHSVIKETDHER